MKKKNIIFMSTRINAGYFGTEKFLDTLISGIKDKYNCEFIGSDKPVEKIFLDQGLESTKFSGGFEPDGLKKRLFSPISFCLGVAKVIRYYPKLKNADLIIYPADIIGESVFTGFWLSLLFGKKTMAIIHKNDCEDSIAKNPFLPIYKFSMKNGVQVFVSNSQFNTWKNKDATTQNTKVIHNGVGVKEFKSIDKDFDKFTFGYIGRIHHDKNLILLAKAIGQLDTQEEVILKIGGLGEDYGEIKAEFDKINNPNIDIQWLGYQSDTDKFFDDINLLIYPSKREGFALVLLEAYERGVSVLTSDIPPFKEAKLLMTEDMIDKNLSFAVNSVTDLQDKIKSIISKKNQFKSSDPVLHSYIENNYSNEKMVNEYIRLIETI